MMILNWGISVAVPPFLLWLLDDCFLQFIQEGLRRIILPGSHIQKQMATLFLFDWLFSWV